MSNKPPIFLISGPPGAGKTTVSTALMQRFPFGIHIPVDDLREWVISGIAHPVPVWTNETGRQFGLARQSAAYTARLYVDAGFAVAIADVLHPSDAQKFFVEPLHDYTIYKILLYPLIEVVLERNARRTNKTFDTAVLEGAIYNVQQSFILPVFIEQGWIVIESSDLTVEETVDAILSHVE